MSFYRDEAALALKRREVYGVFDSLDIPYKVFDHEPIFSAADRADKQVVVDGLICKNLFLRNKEKSRYYLYTLPIDKRADLLALQKKLGESRLSFGDADMLWEMLRVAPGFVSLLNIIGAHNKAEDGIDGNNSYQNVDPNFNNEIESFQGKDPLLQTRENWKGLKLLIDKDTLDVPGIGLHPNDNAATIVFAANMIPILLERYGADFMFIEL